MAFVRRDAGVRVHVLEHRVHVRGVRLGPNLLLLLLLLVAGSLRLLLRSRTSWQASSLFLDGGMTSRWIPMDTAVMRSKSRATRRACSVARAKLQIAKKDMRQPTRETRFTTIKLFPLSIL